MRKDRFSRAVVLVSLVTILRISETFSLVMISVQPYRLSRPLYASKKQSMAQRRKSRAKRLQQTNPYARLPPPKVRADEKKDTSTDSADNDDIQTANEALQKTDSKAKQLLRSQRESVEMLTLVRERVEGLDASSLSSALDAKGYCCIDNFLDFDDIVTKIQLEGKSLYEKELMQVDMDALGLGEYICSIKGGQEQYPICPRSIEFVVSTTKHFPGDFDKTKTMATMRTFSRKSWLASLQLLTGTADAESDPAAAGATFRTVLNDNDSKDFRRLSMVYYAVPAEWKYGGGFTFEDTSGEIVEAKRDRLVIWKSDLPYRPQPWKGCDKFPLASCIELHLVQ